MQHEGKNWYRFVTISNFRAEAVIAILTIPHALVFLLPVIELTLVSNFSVDDICILSIRLEPCGN